MGGGAWGVETCFVGKSGLLRGSASSLSGVAGRANRFRGPAG